MSHLQRPPSEPGGRRRRARPPNRSVPPADPLRNCARVHGVGDHAHKRMDTPNRRAKRTATLAHIGRMQRATLQSNKNTTHRKANTNSSRYSLRQGPGFTDITIKDNTECTAPHSAHVRPARTGMSRVRLKLAACHVSPDIGVFKQILVLYCREYEEMHFIMSAPEPRCRRRLCRVPSLHCPQDRVFTTCTRTGKNTGLRQGHHTAIPPRPELDGDLERELHQYRTLRDAHPVSYRAFARG